MTDFITSEDEPVQRAPLLPINQQIEENAVSMVDEIIERLMERGLYAAAHEVSLWYWGYGMDDSDDEYFIKHMTKQADVARNVAYLSPAATAARNK